MPIIYDAPETLVDIVDASGNILVDPNIPDAVTPLDVDLIRNKPELPPIDYTNLDFSAIKLQLLNLMKANSAKLGYSVRDFADSNTAGMMLNLMSYLGQMLSYHTDAMVNELFLDTSQSAYASYRLLNMFKYKPSRPRQGVVMLKVTRAKSTAASQAAQDAENNTEIILSSSTARKKLSFGGETFELFPAKVSSSGIFEPDYLGDLIIPAYKVLSSDDPDADLLEEDTNTYTCFALSGTTKVEDFRANGKANQTITLTNSPVLDSNIIVQVQDTSLSIPGKVAYETWGELSYLALAGFSSATSVSTTKNLNAPYLIAPFKLSDAAYNLKKNSALPLGTLLAIDYNQEAFVASYSDFLTLTVPYRVGIVSSLESSTVADSQYVDLLLYHPSYLYGRTGDNSYSGVQTKLTTVVKDKYFTDIPWSSGDILYLLGTKSVYNGMLTQPQLISDTQLQLADTSVYPDIKFLNDNPQYKIAVGKAISDTVMAVGISADVDTYYTAESIYEITWDGDFIASIRFGDGQFGKIPENGAVVKVIYRINDTNSFGYTVKAGELYQQVKINNVVLTLNNEYSSAPSTSGESIETAKELATRFYAAQDRAVTPDDYLLLAKRFNPSYKTSIALLKSDADGSIIRLYSLYADSDTSVKPLTVTEKYQLRNYLNQYKCIGADIEIADGITRNIDIRVDARLKAGYLSGQVKNDITLAATEFFKLSNTDMGKGFNAAEFIKAVSKISGVKTLDLYLGGYASAYLADGTEVATGVKTFKQLKSIPSYKESASDFPKVASEYEILFGLEDPVKPYEVLVLDTLTVNVLT